MERFHVHRFLQNSGIEKPNQVISLELNCGYLNVVYFKIKENEAVSKINFC